jgi:YD repeat-containing protein
MGTCGPDAKTSENTVPGLQVGDPVDAGNGEFHFSRTFLNLGGPAGPAAVIHYRTRVGFRWNILPELEVITETAQAAVDPGDGKYIVFNENSGQWVLDDNQPTHWELKETTDYFYFMDPDTETVTAFKKLAAGTRPAWQTDRKGNRLTWGYADEITAQPQSLSDGLGRELTLTVMAGKLVQIQDQCDRTVVLTYGAACGGQTVFQSITDASGKTTTFQYDAAGDACVVTGVTDPEGNTPYTQVMNSKATLKIKQINILCCFF